MARRYCFKLSQTLALFAATMPLWAQTASTPGSASKPAATPAGSASPAVGQVIAASSAPAHPLSAKEVRDAQIVADTEKLYELAQQLKIEVDKSTKDTLSLTVVRKATEIEKLARTISDRMKSN